MTATREPTCRPSTGLLAANYEWRLLVPAERKQVCGGASVVLESKLAPDRAGVRNEYPGDLDSRYARLRLAESSNPSQSVAAILVADGR